MSNGHDTHNHPDYHGNTRRVGANIRGGGSHNGGYKRAPRRRMPVTLAVLIDVLLAGLIILAFFLTNYVWPQEILPVALPTQTISITASPDVSAIASIPTATGMEQSQPTASIDPASWRTKFADKFTNGEVIKDASSYKSANINISISRKQENDVTYFIADIYIADIQFLKTGFAKKVEKIAYTESTPTIAKEFNAIIAINGDLCLDNDGFVMRNGLFYKDQKAADQLVMYRDGSMQTFSANELDRQKIKTGEADAYQVWTFGPMLLKDGQPMTDFISPQHIAGADNPRTAIGYYEPGHYCFVVVDGRQPGYSGGYSYKQLSQLFYNLGCKVAFNLDGGQTSEMAFMGNLVNQPIDGGRSTSDILFVADE